MLYLYLSLLIFVVNEYEVNPIELLVHTCWLTKPWENYTYVSRSEEQKKQRGSRGQWPHRSEHLN